jgi:Predicted transcriptional regulators
MENMIGKRLKARRKEMGFTLLQINAETGISTGILSAWERGDKMPSSPSLIKLSELLQCSTDWILFGEEHFQDFHKSEILNKLSNSDYELLNKFKQLDAKDQEDILIFINIKLDKRRKRETLSHSLANDTTETA